ncbi:SAC3 family protein C [Punica granatum]|uniref:SAC3 family protein C n=2 Tax=Punica granatum TaxID=22663 RepID=A0A6P8C1Q3_PUNGR|nr:SAC3 family protein C [Punica granatum]PKI68746.1 hypothetical protein CRG98_010803 [Punica granatum]
MERDPRRRGHRPLPSSSSSSGRTVIPDSRSNFVPSRRSHGEAWNRNASSFHSRGRSSRNPPPGSANSDGRDPSGTVSGLEEAAEESSGDVPSLVGTCPFMCPASEMAQRERLRDLAVFERLHGNPKKTSPDLAVKKFCRTISTKDVKSSDVRPLSVLENTLDYLLNLMDSSGEPFEVVHDFIFDRTRSIRQDLSMQNIVDRKAISMFEKMVKFHVISHHKLQFSSEGTHHLEVSSSHHLNMEQLAKTLTSLYHLYELNRVPDSAFENEPEFRSLYVLLCLNYESPMKGESLALWFRHVPASVIRSKEMIFARTVLRCFRFGNYKRFLDTVAAEASFLQFCILESHINEVRALAVSCINSSGYKLHPFSLANLSSLLMMKESEAESFCNACGLEISIDNHGNKMLPTKQSTFSRPKAGFGNYGFLCPGRTDK